MREASGLISLREVLSCWCLPVERQEPHNPLRRKHLRRRGRAPQGVNPLIATTYNYFEKVPILAEVLGWFMPIIYIGSKKKPWLLLTSYQLSDIMGAWETMKRKKLWVIGHKQSRTKWKKACQMRTARFVKSVGSCVILGFQTSQ